MMSSNLDDAVDANDRYERLELSITTQLSRVEEELVELSKPNAFAKLRYDKPVSARSISTTKDGISSYWEQVLKYIRQDQDEKAVFALIRVVQRMLDEKAYAKTLHEKATKSYVDNLYERVSSGVKDNMNESIADSCDNLENQVITLAEKIGEVKLYFQTQLRVVKNQITSLKEINEESKSKKGDLESGRSASTSSSKSNAFTICPPKQYR
ncbi:hypothetical protein TRFO_24959 [Tritrichomonas foetus]|uniref:Uncharacterized protein n=1 Tax=Tritrichomonas foetus TaxID=1144522 RepID=A0A1J4KB51_9EUKA|nr:hypothetical protein TRFO_24959 [Tritrichomonas foetus]|eukprot:OHT06918.1 hypothetical protein TRFO_24959 [Tritrichomonas foetus]